MNQEELFGKEKISKVLLKLAPPVMLAQLIQALYNIIDSLFVGHYSDSGLTALSIVYPLQLLMIALAVGTGVGINTIMASKLGIGEKKEADAFAGIALPIELVLYGIFALVCYFIMPYYARLSTSSEAVINDVVTYGRITTVFSFGLFIESGWTKVLQARGNMKVPMFAQVAGAIVNIVLDPILIFGYLGLPQMGIAGAAIATVAGQMVAAIVVIKGFTKSPSIREYPHRLAIIFKLGIPNILMQSAYTFYIFGLNLILSEFSDQAVTALGLYYKWQSFFFIPLGAMQTCIVPIVSYNYAARNIDRCRKTLKAAIIFGMALMCVGVICFETLPEVMLRAFSSDEEVISIGSVGFRIVGISFIPLVTFLIFPVFFQAVGYSLKSSFLTILRTVICFVPLGYLFSRFGLTQFWIVYPVTETIVTIVGFLFYRSFLKKDYVKNPPMPLIEGEEVALKPSKPGVIIAIAREHGSSGKQIGKLLAQRLGIPFYYKEMIALAADESGLDQEFISNLHKNAPEILHDLYLSSHVVSYAIKAQKDIIEKIAEKGSCVIVGRASDYVLKEHPEVIKVFIHAPMEYRIKRIMEVYGDDYKTAKKHIKKSDKARASYYRHISGKKWGEEGNYDLSIDSSIGLEESVNSILDFINKSRQESSWALN